MAWCYRLRTHLTTTKSDFNISRHNAFHTHLSRRGPTDPESATRCIMNRKVARTTATVHVLQHLPVRARALANVL